MPVQASFSSLPSTKILQARFNQFGLRCLSELQNLFTSKNLPYALCTIAVATVAIAITLIVKKWMSYLKGSSYFTKTSTSIVRNFSLNDVKMTPCSSPVDIRSISPSVRMPKGIENTSNNSPFIAVIQLLSQNDIIFERIIEQLVAIGSQNINDRNPFLEFAGTKAHIERQAKSINAKIAVSEKEIAPLFERDFSEWSEEKKLNLKSLYFHISLKKSAELAVFLLKFWMQDYSSPSEYLTSKQAQLLRLCLTKLIYHNQPSEIVHQEGADILRVPGLHFGISPLSSDQLEPLDFFKKLMFELQNLSHSLKFEEFRIQKMTSYTTYEAKGLKLGRITKSRTKLEDHLTLEIRANSEIDLSHHLNQLGHIRDSRGLVDESTGKITPLNMSFFLTDGDLLPSHAKSSHHERIVSGYRFDRIFYIYLNSVNDKFPGTHSSKPPKILFSDPHEMTIEFSSCIQKTTQKFTLKSFIAYLGPSKTAGHFVNFVRKISSTKQNSFFKCDDQTISVISRDIVQKIFDSTFQDPIWGSVYPYLLEFEKI